MPDDDVTATERGLRAASSKREAVWGPVRELLVTFAGGQPFYGMSKNALRLAFWGSVMLVIAVLVIA